MSNSTKVTSNNLSKDALDASLQDSFSSGASEASAPSQPVDVMSYQLPPALATDLAPNAALLAGITVASASLSGATSILEHVQLSDAASLLSDAVDAVGPGLWFDLSSQKKHLQRFSQNLKDMAALSKEVSAFKEKNNLPPLPPPPPELPEHNRYSFLERQQEERAKDELRVYSEVSRGVSKLIAQRLAQLKPGENIFLPGLWRIFGKDADVVVQMTRLESKEGAFDLSLHHRQDVTPAPNEIDAFGQKQRYQTIFSVHDIQVDLAGSSRKDFHKVVLNSLGQLALGNYLNQGAVSYTSVYASLFSYSKEDLKTSLSETAQFSLPAAGEAQSMKVLLSILRARVGDLDYRTAKFEIEAALFSAFSQTSASKNLGKNAEGLTDYLLDEGRKNLARSAAKLSNADVSRRLSSAAIAAWHSGLETSYEEKALQQPRTLEGAVKVERANDHGSGSEIERANDMHLQSLHVKVTKALSEAAGATDSLVLRGPDFFVRNRSLSSQSLSAWAQKPLALQIHDFADMFKMTKDRPDSDLHYLVTLFEDVTELWPLPSARNQKDDFWGAPSNKPAVLLNELVEIANSYGKTINHLKRHSRFHHLLTNLHLRMSIETLTFRALKSSSYVLSSKFIELPFQEILLEIPEEKLSRLETVISWFHAREKGISAQNILESNYYGTQEVQNIQNFLFSFPEVEVSFQEQKAKITALFKNSYSGSAPSEESLRTLYVTAKDRDFSEIDRWILRDDRDFELPPSLKPFKQLLQWMLVWTSYRSNYWTYYEQHEFSRSLAAALKPVDRYSRKESQLDDEAFFLVKAKTKSSNLEESVEYFHHHDLVARPSLRPERVIAHFRRELHQLKHAEGRAELEYGLYAKSSEASRIDDINKGNSLRPFLYEDHHTLSNLYELLEVGLSQFAAGEEDLGATLFLLRLTTLFPSDFRRTRAGSDFLGRNGVVQSLSEQANLSIGARSAIARTKILLMDTEAPLTPRSAAEFLAAAATWKLAAVPLRLRDSYGDYLAQRVTNKLRPQLSVAQNAPSFRDSFTEVGRAIFAGLQGKSGLFAAEGSPKIVDHFLTQSELSLNLYDGSIYIGERPLRYELINDAHAELVGLNLAKTDSNLVSINDTTFELDEEIRIRVSPAPAEDRKRITTSELKRRFYLEGEAHWAHFLESGSTIQTYRPNLLSKECVTWGLPGEGNSDFRIIAQEPNSRDFYHINVSQNLSEVSKFYEDGRVEQLEQADRIPPVLRRFSDGAHIFLWKRQDTATRLEIKNYNLIFIFDRDGQARLSTDPRYWLEMQPATGFRRVDIGLKLINERSQRRQLIPWKELKSQSWEPGASSLEFEEPPQVKHQQTYQNFYGFENAFSPIGREASMPPPLREPSFIDIQLSDEGNLSCENPCDAIKLAYFLLIDGQWEESLKAVASSAGALVWDTDLEFLSSFPRLFEHFAPSDRAEAGAIVLHACAAAIRGLRGREFTKSLVGVTFDDDAQSVFVQFIAGQYKRYLERYNNLDVTFRLNVEQEQALLSFMRRYSFKTGRYVEDKIHSSREAESAKLAPFSNSEYAQYTEGGELFLQREGALSGASVVSRTKIREITVEKPQDFQGLEYINLEPFFYGGAPLPDLKKTQLRNIESLQHCFQALLQVVVGSESIERAEILAQLWILEPSDPQNEIARILLLTSAVHPKAAKALFLSEKSGGGASGKGLFSQRLRDHEIIIQFIKAHASPSLVKGLHQKLFVRQILRPSTSLTTRRVLQQSPSFRANRQIGALTKYFPAFSMKRAASNETGKRVVGDAGDDALALELKDAINARLVAFGKEEADFGDAFNFDPAEVERTLASLALEMSPHLQRLEADLLGEANDGGLDKEKSAVHQLRVRGREVEVITFAHLAQAFAKQDMNALQVHNETLSADRLAALAAQLRDFLTQATAYQQICRALTSVRGALDVALEEDARSSMHNEAVRQITSTRWFDPEAAPALLVFEHYSDLLLSRVQVETLSRFLATPSASSVSNMVQQLNMGAGKTRVLLPLLSFLRARDRKLPVVVVPKELFAVNYVDLARTSAGAFRQLCRPFEFNRADPLTLERIEFIEKELRSLQDNEGFVVSTREAIQSFKLSYIALLEEGRAKITGGNSEDEERILDKMSEVLSFLRRNACATLDEVDTLLDVRNEFNFNAGAHLGVERFALDLARQIFSALSTRAELSETLRLQENRQFGLSETNLQRISIRAADLCLEQMIPQVRMASKEERSVLLQYISSKTLESSPDAIQVILKKDKESLDQLACLRDQVLNLLPLTLRRQAGEHYGVPPEEPMGYAIPFAKSRPVRGAQFGNSQETVNFTYLWYLAKGISTAALEELVEQQKKQAEYARDGGFVTVKMAAIAERYERIVKGTTLAEVTASELTQLDAARVDQARIEISARASNMVAFVDGCVLPNLRQYQLNLTSNGHDLVDTFLNAQGFTGTPWNSLTYPSSVQTFHANSTDGVTLRIFQDPVKTSLFTLASASVENLLEGQAQSGSLEGLHAIVDAGAVLQNYRSFEVASALKTFFSRPEQRPLHIDAILFFDEDRGDLNVWSFSEDKPRGLAGSDAKSLRDEGLIPSRTFVYFDQAHSTGADIPLPPTGRGILTVGILSSLRDMQQGAMRLRQLARGQRLTLALSPELARQLASLPEDVRSSKKEDVGVEAVLDHVINVESAKLGQDKVRSLMLEMQNKAFQVALQATQECTPSERRVAYTALRPLLVREMGSLSFEALGGTTLMPTLEALHASAERLANLIQSCRDKLPSRLESAKGGLTSLIERLRDRNYLEKQTLTVGALPRQTRHVVAASGAAGVERQQETQAQVQVEQEVEIEAVDYTHLKPVAFVPMRPRDLGFPRGVRIPSAAQRGAVQQAWQTIRTFGNNVLQQVTAWGRWVVDLVGATCRLVYEATLAMNPLSGFDHSDGKHSAYQVAKTDFATLLKYGAWRFRCRPINSALPEPLLDKSIYMSENFWRTTTTGNDVLTPLQKPIHFFLAVQARAGAPREETAYIAISSQEAEVFLAQKAPTFSLFSRRIALFNAHGQLVRTGVPGVDASLVKSAQLRRAALQMMVVSAAHSGELKLPQAAHAEIKEWMPLLNLNASAS